MTASPPPARISCATPAWILVNAAATSMASMPVQMVPARVPPGRPLTVAIVTTVRNAQTAVFATLMATSLASSVSRRMARALRKTRKPRSQALLSERLETNPVLDRACQQWISFHEGAGETGRAVLFAPPRPILQVPPSADAAVAPVALQQPASTVRLGACSGCHGVPAASLWSCAWHLTQRDRAWHTQGACSCYPASSHQFDVCCVWLHVWRMANVA